MNYTGNKKVRLTQAFCGCRIVHIDGETELEYCPLHKAALDMYDALKNLPEPKSILEEAAYTGGDVSKKWIAERSQYIDGYNRALKDVAKLHEQALAKAENKG